MTDGSSTETVVIDAATGAITGDIVATPGSITNTELASMARGTVKVGNASAAASDLSAKTAGQVLMGDGTDVVSQAITGDFSLSGAGVATVSPLVTANISVNVSSAELLALYTTAKEVVAAPAAGFVHEFLSMELIYKHVSTQYTIGSATNLTIAYTDKSGADTSVALACTGLIDQASNQLRMVARIATNVTPVAASPLVLKLAGGNPSAGDGTMTLKIRYRTVATS